MAKIILTQYVVGADVKLKGKRKRLLAFLSALVHTLAQMRRHGLKLSKPVELALPDGVKMAGAYNQGKFYISPEDLQNPDFISELKKARYKLATVDGASI